MPAGHIAQNDTSIIHAEFKQLCTRITVRHRHAGCLAGQGCNYAAQAEAHRLAWRFLTVAATAGFEGAVQVVEGQDELEPVIMVMYGGGKAFDYTRSKALVREITQSVLSDEVKP